MCWFAHLKHEFFKNVHCSNLLGLKVTVIFLHLGLATVQKITEKISKSLWTKTKENQVLVNLFVL